MNNAVGTNSHYRSCSFYQALICILTVKAIGHEVQREFNAPVIMSYVKVSLEDYCILFVEIDELSTN
jgi:hypothetical protein